MIRFGGFSQPHFTRHMPAHHLGHAFAKTLCQPGWTERKARSFSLNGAVVHPVQLTCARGDACALHTRQCIEVARRLADIVRMSCKFTSPCLPRAMALWNRRTATRNQEICFEWQSKSCPCIRGCGIMLHSCRCGNDEPMFGALVNRANPNQIDGITAQPQYSLSLLRRADPNRETRFPNTAT
jgi:hypothetical protein